MSPSSLKAWPLARPPVWLQQLLWRTEQTAFVTCVPGESCCRGARPRCGVTKHFPPTDTGSLQVAEAADMPCIGAAGVPDERDTYSTEGDREV